MDLVQLVAATDSEEDLSRVVSDYLASLPWDLAFVKIINLLERSMRCLAVVLQSEMASIFACSKSRCTVVGTSVTCLATRATV